MNLKVPFLIALAACIAMAAPSKGKKTGSFVDERDGKKYKTIKIGKQTWMSENLSYDAKGSYCYDDDKKNCKKYGRLYTWKAAKKSCPAGWKLPANEDWAKVVRAVGTKVNTPFKAQLAGQRICFNQNDTWSPYCESTKSFGMPGEKGAHFSYDDMNKAAFFWSSTEAATYIANYYTMGGYNERFTEQRIEENFAFSVRCVKE